MSQLADIKAAQDCLEESFTKRMAELEAQLLGGGAAKDTVAKVAEEFRTFRELMFSMLGLLRKQIKECSQALDTMETRHRCKALVFLGVPESEKEDCRASLFNVIRKLELPNTTALNISACHRIGVPGKDHKRPILVWFSDVQLRSAVWKAKTRLKGTSVSVKEFLTKSRQAIFVKARQHFGMRACWTQDGVIVIKAADGTRHKIVSTEGLDNLMQTYSRDVAGSSPASRSGVSVPGTSTTNPKLRK